MEILFGRLKKGLLVLAVVSIAVNAHGIEQEIFSCDGLQITSEFERLVGNGASQYAHCTFRLLITQKSIIQFLAQYDYANNASNGKLEVMAIDNCDRELAFITFSTRNVSYYENNLYDFTHYSIASSGKTGARSLVVRRTINNTQIHTTNVDLSDCQ